MLKHKAALEREGFSVTLPMLDDDGTVEEIMEGNRKAMWNCDEIHCFWDGHSLGTAFDFGMAYYARKPFKLVYLNDHKIEDGMKAYSYWCFGTYFNKWEEKK